MRLRRFAEADVAGKRVLMRVDYNVPVIEGRIDDDSRVRATLETLGELVRAGSRIILISHLGRPGGKPAPECSLRPVATCLSRLLGREVGFCDAPFGSAELRGRVDALGPGDLLLLENLRFDPREEANDPGFAGELRALADVFVQEAFGVVHRAHASTSAVPEAFGAAFAGPLLAAEVSALWRLLERPEHPFAVLVGGAKVADKLGTLTRLGVRANHLMLGGALGSTFFLAAGLEVGRSKVDRDQVHAARTLINRIGTQLRLPKTVVVAPGPDGPGREVPAGEVGPDDMILDIGPGTVADWRPLIEGAKTLFWNGPMGLYEQPAFSEGTRAVAEIVGASKAFSVVGGGDSLAALAHCGMLGRISHPSTGGGAALELLEGKVLPGLVAVTETP